MSAPVVLGRSGSMVAWSPDDAAVARVVDERHRDDKPIALMFLEKWGGRLTPPGEDPHRPARPLPADRGDRVPN